uniref:aldolase/citrate lyase family protein n=1 Tax=uncultured Sphingomonas sp. TaxID=158754 RepID=UPI0035CA6587
MLPCASRQDSRVVDEVVDHAERRDRSIDEARRRLGRGHGEYGVAPHDKGEARRETRAAAELLRAAGKDVVLRINARWRDAAADLEAALGAAISAIMVSKVETPHRIVTIAEMIGEGGNEVANVAIIALIESASGLDAAAQIARAPRLAGLALDPEDSAAAMGVEPSPDCSISAAANSRWRRQLRALWPMRRRLDRGLPRRKRNADGSDCCQSFWRCGRVVHPSASGNYCQRDF